MFKYVRRLFTIAKIYDNPTEAIADIRTGSSIAIGGYMNAGVPENLVNALKAYGNYDFTVISQGSSIENYGVNALINNKQVKRLITPYLGSKEINRQYHNGELELELVPGGTLAEKIRAAGAGIPGFWTSTGVGTIIEEGGFPIKYKRGGAGILIQAEGKEKRFFNGREHIYEEAIRTEYALVKAWKADKLGNCIYHRAAMNFNPEIAICAKHTIVEAEEIVPIGELPPDEIATPAIFVERIVLGEKYSQHVNQKMQFDEQDEHDEKTMESLTRIAKRVSKELKAGMYVKIDQGIPSLVPQYLDEGVILASGSGIIGVGKSKAYMDPSLVYEDGILGSITKGGVVVSTNIMMDLLRGGHFDASVMGAFQVSSFGDLANWYVPGVYVMGIGGSMDSVADKNLKIIVAMKHTHNDRPKIVSECTLPLTGRNCVKLLVTELGVFDFREDGLNLMEMAEGVTLEHIRSKTGCGFTISSDLKTMKID